MYLYYSVCYFCSKRACSGWRAGVPEGRAAAGPRARGAGAAGGGEGPRGDHLQHARPLEEAQWATCKCLTIMFNTQILNTLNKIYNPHGDTFGFSHYITHTQ